MIWVRKTENEQGGYTDAAGKRYTVEWCVGIVGSTPEAEGYSRHDSIQTACDAWGLSVYVDPEAAAEFEALTYNEETNEY